MKIKLWYAYLLIIFLVLILVSGLFPQKYALPLLIVIIILSFIVMHFEKVKRDKELSRFFKLSGKDLHIETKKIITSPSYLIFWFIFGIVAIYLGYSNFPDLPYPDWIFILFGFILAFFSAYRFMFRKEFIKTYNKNLKNKSKEELDLDKKVTFFIVSFIIVIGSIYKYFNISSNLTTGIIALVIIFSLVYLYIKKRNLSNPSKNPQ